MSSIARIAKQLITLVVAVLIIGGVVTLFHRTVNPPQPTPTPDPRTALSPITILSQRLFQVTDHSFDFVARIRNPNTGYGSGDIQYELIGHWDGTGGNDNTEVLRSGSFYILPGQTKYIVVTPLLSTNQLRKAELKIKSVDWQELDPLISQAVNLVVLNTAYVPHDGPGVFGKAGGSVINNSNFDLNRLDVAIVAVDSSGTPLAVNKTEIRTVLARTTRGFEVSWFSPFDGTVARVDSEANFNPFENNALLNSYKGTQEQFQMY